MENRPAPLRSRRVCRFCLTESEPLNFIYERDHSKPFQVPLTLQIMSCVAIEVYAADGMPQMICNICRWNLDRSYKFKMQCKKADEALRAYPMTGVLPRPFPPISNESPDASKRASEQRIEAQSAKKPRVDNGDRDRQRSDRQQEKQGHKGGERGNDLYKEDQEDSDMDQTANEKDDRKLEPGEIRVHACDQCDRTFPLRQSLQLHIQRAHRDRNYKCTECDRMFFSKYDLAKHMATHSSEKPFSCSICNKTFTRANLLQRHEKMHREDMSRYPCQHCDREFFSAEELEKHEDTSHKSTKPFQCNICNKRFTYKQGLERHELLHNDDKTFVCEYCKEAFRTSTKLARHLATHSGHRPYLCKLCPRTFLLSHHLTRHMRSHSVEKRHVCEDCGKAFKRKESLEVHQLTHTKRSGMALTCDVCQESCRNRADYVTHIKQHIEAGEKMGPDGLQPDKGKMETESEEEEDDEEEGYTDGDDDYEPPAYVVKKMPKIKPQPPESEEEDDPARVEQPQQHEADERKEQIVYVRGKDGNIVKKTIKTLMPIQRRDESSSSSSPKGGKTVTAVSPAPKKDETVKARHEDNTEAEVQKIVASVFKEHKIPLKHTSNIPQENQASGSPRTPTIVKEEKCESATPGKTVKVIKRIVVRKPITPGEQPSTPSGKEGENILQTPTGSATKVTKRVIVRRIIRHGDTTREVIMNPDGTIIDPSELAKLPTGNVVKRVVVKKALDNKNSTNFVQQVLKPLTDGRLAGTSVKGQTESLLEEGPKFELKTSQSSEKSQSKSEAKKATTPPDQETKEKLELLEKRVEQQRIKIEELQARKQQESEAIDESLPERHDESEDEQQLPLKRVFVKRKQSIYDEEQEYDNDKDDKKEQEVPKESEASQVKADNVEAPVTRSKQLSITSSKVYTNKKVIFVKTEDPGEIEEMSREIGSILNSSDNVVKMQENVLTNLTQISGIGDEAIKGEEVLDGQQASESLPEPMELEDSNNEDDSQVKIDETPADNEILTGTEVTSDAAVAESKEIDNSSGMIEIAVAVAEQEIGHQEEDPGLTLVQEDISGTSDIFESTDSPMICPKTDVNLEESVIELAHNETINLNDTNESQDSLEDKLSQMEG